MQEAASPSGFLSVAGRFLPWFIRQSGHPASVTSPDGRWADANPEMLELCGLPEKGWSLIGPAELSTMASDRGRIVIEAMSRAASTAAVEMLPVLERVVLPEEWREHRFLTIRMIPLPGQNGAPAAFLSQVDCTALGSQDDIARRADEVLHRLAVDRAVQEGDLDTALPRIIDEASRLFGIDSAGIWLMTGDAGDQLKCRASWDRSTGPLCDPPGSGPYSAFRYFDELRSQRVLAVPDVMSDPRVAEFADSYYRKTGVVSTLDAPVILHGALSGVLCLEHRTGPPRRWSAAEQAYAISFSEIVSNAIEARARAVDRAALERSEHEKDLILDGVEDAVVHLDTDMRIIWANRVARSALRTSDRPGGILLTDLWRNTDLPEASSSAVASMGRGEDIEFDLAFPDGRIRHTILTKLGNGDDDIRGYALFAHDVTEKRFAEDLRDASKRIVEAGLNAPGMDELYASIHSVIGTLVTADNFYIAIYDQRKDLIEFPYYVDRHETRAVPRRPARGLTEMVLRTSSPLFLTQEEMQGMIERGEMDLHGRLSRWWMGIPLTVENRVFGVMAVQSYSDNPPLDERQHEALLTLSGTAALVIERKRFEAALGESETRYRTVIDRANDGIILARDGKVVFGNPKLHSMLGVEEIDFSGQPFTDFLAPAEREKVLERHRRRLEGEDLPSIYETVLLTRQGIELPVELHASVVVENGMTATLSIIRDISERRKIEEERKLLERQIQQSQKLESLGILAGGIAHDFNNLLMGILGNAGLALMELPPESPVRRTLERLETAAMRAAELTNQLLAYSGRGKFVVEPVSINTLIEEMINLLTAAVPKNVVLRLEQGSTVPLIDGDATQLRQVVMNLIINASEAIGDRSGVITLATGLTTVDKSYLAGTYMDEDLPEGVYTFLEVSDTGCGMDDKTKSRIFDPFFTTKFTGRGLGLAAVLGIVRGHHGTLKVYSEPGRGSTFKILFPAVGSDPALSRARDADADTRTPGGTILIVDDEETVRTVAKLALEKSGFRTISARDGREALDVFRRENGAVDVVLLDMTMPHLGGEETFRELRRIRPDVKVILSSGYNEYDAINRFAGKGLAGFIQKPYRPVDLMAKVRSVISGRNGNGSSAMDGGRP